VRRAAKPLPKDSLAMATRLADTRRRIPARHPDSGPCRLDRQARAPTIQPASADEFPPLPGQIVRGSADSRPPRPTAESPVSTCRFLLRLRTALAT
jgi:hypothetical protein